MKKAMIVGSGNCDLTGVDFKQYRFIMACDGGANYLSAVSECPHALIGDFDSVEPVVNMEMEMLGVVKHHMNEEVRECTDMKSALDFLAKYDYEQIDLYGALGTRMDHSLANMLMLFELEEKNIRGRIVGDHNIITALMAEGEPVERSLADAPEGWTVSLVLLTHCEGLEITGMKYELEKTDLGLDQVTRCVSNEVETNQAKVRLEKGRLLIIYTRD